MSRPGVINVSIPLKLTCDPDRARNSLHLTIEDCCAQIYINDKHVGRVAGCIGGHIEVAVNQTGRLPIMYTINPVDLYEAVASRIREYSPVVLIEEVSEP